MSNQTDPAHRRGEPRAAGRVVRPREPYIIPAYDHGEEAEFYADSGLGVIPLAPKSKKAQIRWKEYQTRLPTPDEVGGWWRTWPHAGIAAVLGPASGMLAVDVDGPEAHEELLRRLGAEPSAPKVLTGSGKPFRYHLLFRHPQGVGTRAKITPWHSQLEFRGLGGLSVLPPSVHKSGKRYRWAPRRSLHDLDLPDLPPPILDALLARDGRDAARGESDASVPAERLGDVQRRALALIRKELTAVEGRGGDKATFTAACYLVVDFGLTVDEAMPVMRKWNRTNSRPEWSDEGLLHKLQMADDRPGPRGRLLQSPDAKGPKEEDTVDGPAPSPRRTSPAAPPAEGGPPFSVPVPDWVLASWSIARPRKPFAKRGRPLAAVESILPLILAGVVLQKSSVVLFPDVAMAQIVWGGDRAAWPDRWRWKLAARFARPGAQQVIEVHLGGVDCPAACALHGNSDVRHRHFRVRLAGPHYLGFFQPFATGGTAEGGFTYEFKGLRSHHPTEAVAKAKTKEIRELRKEGDLCAVYLPAWVFGPLALAPGPCRVLKAVTHELTRSRSGRGDRSDKAEVLRGSEVPLPDEGKTYVAFNGNSSRRRAGFHGRGYSLATWMGRAGYESDPGSPAFRVAAEAFLADLEALREPLGLVAAVRVPGREGWSTVGEAIAEVGVVRPRRMARECLVKVYGPADYPERWRTFFAGKLGLGAIPKGEPGEGGPAPAGGVVPACERLARWMKSEGLTDAGLAERLGVSRTLVCKCRTGSRRISRGFQAKLAKVIDAPHSKATVGCDKSVPKRSPV